MAQGITIAHSGQAAQGCSKLAAISWTPRLGLQPAGRHQHSHMHSSPAELVCVPTFICVQCVAQGCVRVGQAVFCPAHPPPPEGEHRSILLAHLTDFNTQKGFLHFRSQSVLPAAPQGLSWSGRRDTDAWLAAMWHQSGPVPRGQVPPLCGSRVKAGSDRQGGHGWGGLTPVVAAGQGMGTLFAA